MALREGFRHRLGPFFRWFHVEEKVGRKVLGFLRRNKYLFSFATGLFHNVSAREEEKEEPLQINVVPLATAL